MLMEWKFKNIKHEATYLLETICIVLEHKERKKEIKTSRKYVRHIKIKSYGWLIM